MAQGRSFVANMRQAIDPEAKVSRSSRNPNGIVEHGHIESLIMDARAFAAELMGVGI